MKTYMKSLCLVLSLGIAPVSLYSIRKEILVSLQEVQEAAAAAQEQMETEVLGELAMIAPDQDFTDQEIRAALDQARPIIAGNQEENPELERRVAEDLAIVRPGQDIPAQEIRAIVANQLVVSEAVRILSAQRGLQPAQ